MAVGFMDAPNTSEPAKLQLLYVRFEENGNGLRRWISVFRTTNGQK
jgi:hypothetical protein